jgi:hypothetical protein
MRRASQPLTILPIALHHVRGLYTRAQPATSTTEFSMTRFLTPALCGFKGWSLFLDCDMVARVDVYDLFDHVQDGADAKAVYVCQHDYVPKEGAKATGQQLAYPRKNWSSCMLFNNAACQDLSPAYVNTASGLELHRFRWMPDVAIGSLPLEWNWLVGEYPENPHAKILHYTLGTPCFPGYERGEHAADWWAEHAAMSAPLRADFWGREAALASALRTPVVG